MARPGWRWLIFNDARLDRARIHGLLGFLVGGLVIFACLRAKTHYGLLTGFALVLNGATCACMVKWRTEEGLWMLAALFLVFSTFMWVLFATNGLRGVSPISPAPLVVDVTLTTILFGWNARFLLSVILANRRATSVQGRDGWER